VIRVLVTGGGGQLATELERAAWPAGIQGVVRPRAGLDITDPDAVAAALADDGIQAVINAAAYTAVDRAETEPERAFAVNATGPANLAAACARRGLPLIHVSTDYVFDGAKAGWYCEDDPIAPLGVYGRSKAEGERLIREALPRHVIVRTAWLYAAHGQNFVRTMLRLAAERPELRVVQDQLGCPTAAAELARILVAITQAVLQPGAACWGTYHGCGGGETSWYGFAQEIFRLRRERVGSAPHLVPITTADYPTPARRPANSRLDCGKLARGFGLTASPWPDSLKPVVASLLAAASG
jgi:dTDP-4-dehydrorhamnose reductase